MSKIKLLCTGSGGFVMSNFVRHVLKNNADYQIISVDKFSNRSLNSIYRNKSHIVHIGDVSDHHFIDMVFTLEKPDYVIHGATSSTQDYNQDMVKSNILGTQVIIDNCISHNVKKLIYTSTAYENKNTYFASKLSAELLIESVKDKLKYNIVRSCNAFGPKQDKNKFIPLIIKNIIDGTHVNLAEKAMDTNDWIHVQDFCSAILKVLISGQENMVYDITANQVFSNLEVVQIISNLLDKPNTINFENQISSIKRLNVFNEDLKDLGWNNSFKFREGLEHTVNWYVNNYYFLKG